MNFFIFLFLEHCCNTYTHWFNVISIYPSILLFPHKTAYFLNDLHDPFKNTDGNSKFDITL